MNKVLFVQQQLNFKVNVIFNSEDSLTLMEARKALI